MFANTPWKYGVVAEEERVTPETGNRFLRITAASVDESDPKNPYYLISLLDLQNAATITNRYYFYSTNKTTGNKFPNKYTSETLLSLAHAVGGPEFEENPNPDCVIGAVVIGAVERDAYTKKDGSDGTAYRVKTYFAAPKDWVEEFSELREGDIVLQYYEGSEDTDIVDNSAEDESQLTTESASEESEE